MCIPCSIADEEASEEAVAEGGVKREVLYRRAGEPFTRSVGVTTGGSHPRHHHQQQNAHAGVAPVSPPPTPRTALPVQQPCPRRPRPPAAIHTLTPPSAGVSWAGAASPLGLVSAFRQDSSSPPTSTTSSSDAGVAPRPHNDALHPHLTNGVSRPNGLAKSLSLSPPSHSTFQHHGLYAAEENLYKDDKKRSGSTPSREVHNKLEKNRRAHLKECFETLRRQLPSMDDKKISNQTILKAAHRYIQNLKRKEREYEHEMERLAREKIAHQQNLATLKKELSARWDHIDFSTLLPDAASLDQHRDKETKSTTTASEQPDLDEEAARDAGTQASPSTSSDPPSSLSPRLHINQSQGAPSFTTIETTNINGLGAAGPRDNFADPNQPLNLSTSMVDSARASPRNQQAVNQARSPLHNGEWGARQASPHYGQAHYDATTSTQEEVWVTHAVTTMTPTVTRDTVTTAHSEHLPIIGNTGIHLPAQLVAGGMQLNGAPGGLLGQTAIQVITPEGYKLLPADHAPNGSKPLTITITLAHPAEGLDRTDNAEEVKTSAGPMMVALNKNGVSALHLAVPTTARSLNQSQGTNGTVTTVPLNLSVGGTATVKVSQAATSSLIPSYLPITHANGITQLVSGLSSNMGTLVPGIGTPLVAPLVVSQPQRAVVPCNVTTVGTKGLKATAVGGNATSVPLVPAQYATSLTGGALGGLVKPVVVVSAPAAVAGMMAGAHTVASGKP
ncbi:putative Max-binding protein MNT [Penaeus vannamei]|uniref:Max-binding protein MNT n=1 Tax=Penaeus vannamei TaxID=6689 RepID=A0A423UBH0_PENVA|nr:putative Max-binding protein MNT [Penaeus vannamei]